MPKKPRRTLRPTLDLMKAKEATLKQILYEPKNTCGFLPGQRPTNFSSVPNGNISIRARLVFQPNTDILSAPSTEKSTRLGPAKQLAYSIFIDQEARLICDGADDILLCKGLDEIQRLHSFLTAYLAVASRP